MGINIVRTSELVPVGSVNPAAPDRAVADEGRRAVVVRPQGHGDRHIRQCLAYVDRHGLLLVGVADAEGALRMVLAGDADVLVALHRNEVALPPYMRFVSDETVAGRVSPTQRRPQRRGAAS